MKHLKPLILEAKQIGYLYHFTSFEALPLILINMFLSAAPLYQKDTDYVLKNKYSFFVSFTRNSNLWKTLTDIQKKEGNVKFDARLKFNGDILSHKYKIRAFDDNYWNDSLYNGKLTKKPYNLGDEMEERVYLKSEYLNIDKLLLEIVLFFNNSLDFEIFDLAKIKNLCILNNIKLKIYFKDNNETLEII